MLLDQVAGDGTRLSEIDLGVQCPGIDTDLAQGGDLVVHQGNKGGDDHGGTGAAQSGDLVADALAAAGRHQHQRVAAGRHMPDNRLLLPAKSGKPKYPPQNLRRLSAVDGIKHPDQGARSTISTRRASSGVST